MERNVIRELITDINWDLESDAAARLHFSQVTAVPRTLGTRLENKQTSGSRYFQ